MTTLLRRAAVILATLALSSTAAQYEGKGASGTGNAISAAAPGARVSAPSIQPAAGLIPTGTGLPSLPASLPTAAAANGASGQVISAAAAASKAPGAAPLLKDSPSLRSGVGGALAAPSSKGPAARNGGEASGTEQVGKKLGETAKELGPELEKIDGGGDSKEVGEKIQALLEGKKETGGTDTVAGSFDEARIRPFGRPQLPNPRDLYETALSLAQEQAARWGVAPANLAFGEVTASMPAHDERTMHYSFYALVDGGRSAKPILVTMTADRMLTPATPYSARLRAFDETMRIDRQLFPVLSDAKTFKGLSLLTPEQALEEARRALPGLRAGVSFTLRYEQDEPGAPAALRYRFYDDRGNVAGADANGDEAQVFRDAGGERSATASKAVDFFGTLAAAAGVYPLGEAVASHFQLNGILGYLAAWIGVLVLGACVKAVPLPSFRRAGTVIGLGAILSPLLAVLVVGVKTLVGSTAMLGFAAAAGTLKQADPLDGGLPAMYAQAYEAATRAAESSKLPAPELAQIRRTGYGWSFDFRAGTRLVIATLPKHGKAQAYAYGDFEAPAVGVTRALSPEAFEKGARFKARTALAAAAGKLGVAEDQLGLSVISLKGKGRGLELWYVADTEDGRRFAVNARTRAFRALETGPTRAQVESAAEGTASYKGRPWSQTEYNMQLAMAEGGLRKAGATVAQLELFRRITDGHPVLGGGFNNWSGD